jgi:hypothetical protein
MGGGMDDGAICAGFGLREGKPGAELEMFGQNGRSAPRSSIAIFRLASDWRILEAGHARR